MRENRELDTMPTDQQEQKLKRRAHSADFTPVEVVAAASSVGDARFRRFIEASIAEPVVNPGPAKPEAAP